LVCNLISLGEVGAAGSEHLADDRFPARHPPGKADLEQPALASIGEG
jgi:hypothetical protein